MYTSHEATAVATAPFERKEAERHSIDVSSNCGEDIYPGVNTQAGTGPSVNGFKLSPGGQYNLTVSNDWQGRVWGRTNCSFNSDGTGPANNNPSKACGTGDCNGVLNCQVTVRLPASESRKVK